MKYPKLILNYPQTADLIGVSVSTLYRWVESGDFPQPVRLGPARVGFNAAVIEAWVASKGGNAPKDPGVA